MEIKNEDERGGAFRYDNSVDYDLIRPDVLIIVSVVDLFFLLSGEG